MDRGGDEWVSMELSIRGLLFESLRSGKTTTIKLLRLDTSAVRFGNTD